MIQELLDLATGKVYRRVLPDGEWATARGEGDTVPISAGGTGANDVAGAVEALGLTSLKGNGPYVRSRKPTTLNLYTGTTVINFTGAAERDVLSDSFIRSLIGRSFDQTRDTAFCMNGDRYGGGEYLMTLTLRMTDKAIVVVTTKMGDAPGTLNGPVRINWGIVAA